MCDNLEAGAVSYETEVGRTRRSFGKISEACKFYKAD